MSKMFKKSQAAMEFLMTYGWAILVVLVAIGALAYFGVLSPDKFLPAKCVLPAGITCVDFKIDSATDKLTVVLRNGLGADLTDVSFTTTDGTDSCTISNVVAIQNGKDGTLITAATCTAFASGDKFNQDLIVQYTNDDSGLTKTVTGTITGRAE